tara:strand:- start:12 stop:350 length:339 start_codon:yes stop_codon:yes gene_type:complete
MKNIKFDQKEQKINLGENFMDSSLVDFQQKFDPFSVDQKGRAISSDKLDPVGIKPAMNPPMAVPTVLGDQPEEKDPLYSTGMPKKPKKSGQYGNDSKYGIKATTRPKTILKK